MISWIEFLISCLLGWLEIVCSVSTDSCSFMVCKLVSEFLCKNYICMSNMNLFPNSREQMWQKLGLKWICSMFPTLNFSLIIRNCWKTYRVNKMFAICRTYELLPAFCNLAYYLIFLINHKFHSYVLIDILTSGVVEGLKIRGGD